MPASVANFSFIKKTGRESSSARLLNVHRLFADLERIKIGTAKGFEEGMVAAGEYLKRKSQQLVPESRFTPEPKSPSRPPTPTLHDSAFVIKYGVGFKTKVRVGYRKWYAIYVHEILQNVHTKGSAKFLEIPVRDLKVRKYMLEIIRTKAKARMRRKGP